MISKPRPRKCAVKDCRKPFTPFSSMEKWCSAACALTLAKTIQRKQARKEKREWKAKNANRRDITPRAQAWFNRYIRLRDAGLPCISCLRPEHEVQSTDGWKPGGAWDCGHFLGVGAYPELRFEPLNAARQCKSCNSGSYNHVVKARTVSAAYKVNLIARIGLAKVEWLEGPHPPAKYTIEQLKAIEQKYKAMARELLKGEAA